MSDDDARSEFRPDLPSPARVYNFLLSGKDHYPADRVVGENLLAAVPTARIAARENRGFLGRATRYLVREAGIRQFLDIGTGLPSAGQVHEIAQAEAADAKVVYVDNDPVVMAHGRTMLHGLDNATMIRHDIRDPQNILADPELRRMIDLDQPVGLLIVAVLHFLEASDDPYGLVRQLLAPLPAGSHLVLSHLTADADAALEGNFDRTYKTSSRAVPRTEQEILRFFDGLEVLEPKVTWVSLWRPDPGTPAPAHPSESLVYAVVGRKP